MNIMNGEQYPACGNTYRESCLCYGESATLCLALFEGHIAPEMLIVAHLVYISAMYQNDKVRVKRYKFRLMVLG